MLQRVSPYIYIHIYNFTNIYIYICPADLQTVEAKTRARCRFLRRFKVAPNSFKQRASLTEDILRTGFLIVHPQEISDTGPLLKAGFISDRWAVRAASPYRMGQPSKVTALARRAGLGISGLRFYSVVQKATSMPILLRK